jgi:2,3-diketo-5-methylthio-1-phosphopentane phosphatase
VGLLGGRLAFVLDFDGTVVTRDLSTEVVEAFAGEGWRGVERDYRAGRLTIRDWVERMAALLPDDREGLLDFAMRSFEGRPGLAGFVGWARARRCPVAVASDGFGFYIEPILEALGLRGLSVYRNTVSFGVPPRAVVRHPHPSCRVCGTCKALRVHELRAAGARVVFVGDGSNDRFGASQADAIFARDRLASQCDAHGLRYYPWDSFLDVRSTVEEGLQFTGPGAKSLCPPP